MDKVVLVQWLDSRVSDVYQVGSNDLPEICRITSVGFVVYRSQDSLTIARERVDKQWRGVLTIPLGAIVTETPIGSSV